MNTGMKTSISLTSLTRERSGLKVFLERAVYDGPRFETIDIFGEPLNKVMGRTYPAEIELDAYATDGVEASNGAEWYAMMTAEGVFRFKSDLVKIGETRGIARYRGRVHEFEFVKQAD